MRRTWGDTPESFFCWSRKFSAILSRLIGPRDNQRTGARDICSSINGYLVNEVNCHAGTEAFSGGHDESGLGVSDGVFGSVATAGGDTMAGRGKGFSSKNTKGKLSMKFLKISALLAVMLFSAVMMLGVLSLRGLPARGGSGGASGTSLNGDVNCSGKRNVTDAINLLNFLFQGGPEPCAIAQDSGCSDVVAQIKTLQDALSKVAPPSPLDIRCSRTSDGIELGWENPAPYDTVEILKQGQTLTVLTGPVARFVDPAVKPGTTVGYSVRGKLNGAVSAHSAWSPEVPAAPVLGQCLVATNQTDCYGQENAIDCGVPPAKGQDGYYHLGCPADGRFVDNADGTVTDRCTGLMWTKSRMDVNGDFEITEKDEMGWAAGINFIESSTFAGHNDWRMPNVEELLSLVDFSLQSPGGHYAALEFGSDGRLWSSTTGGPPQTAWAYFLDRQIACGDNSAGGPVGVIPLAMKLKDSRHFLVAVRTAN